MKLLKMRGIKRLSLYLKIPRSKLSMVIVYGALLGFPLPAESIDCSKLWGFLSNTVTRFKTRFGIFEQDRDLASYWLSLGPDFSSDVTSLGPKGRILEIGTGNGYFLEAMKGTKPYPENKLGLGQVIVSRAAEGPIAEYTIAPSVEDIKKLNDFLQRPLAERPVLHGITERVSTRSRKRELESQQSDRFHIFEKRLEQLNMPKMGQYDVLIDFYGALSYPTHLTEYLSRFFELTKKGGRIYVQPPELRIKINVDGKFLNFVEWFNLKVKGAKAEIRKFPIRTLSGNELGLKFAPKELDVLVITKEHETVIVPETERAYPSIPLPTGTDFHFFREKAIDR